MCYLLFVMLQAEKVIVHPSYNDVDATADLAIIKISKLRYTEFVQPICIWGPVYDKSNLFGNQATVSLQTICLNQIYIIFNQRKMTLYETYTIHFCNQIGNLVFSKDGRWQ